MGKFFWTIKKPTKEKLFKCYWCDMVAIWAAYNTFYMKDKKPGDEVTENEKDSYIRYACSEHKFLLDLWMSKGYKKIGL